MADFFKRRRIVKTAREWLQHALLSREIRADTAPTESIETLKVFEKRLREALSDGDMDRIQKATEEVRDAALRVMPPRPLAGLRENLEVVVVALAVAMAFRCYFLQPFKIPTGSMQPTLYGIHYVSQSGPTLFDQHPLRLLKWIVFGQWYVEIKADTAGRVRGPIAEGGGSKIFDIGGLDHRIPDGMALAIRHGDEVVTGQVIARGCRVTGDHLFVNRARWNFIRPQRGEIMVFRTIDIPPYPGLALDTHYIKRMCGLPGERISIRTPKLIVNGKEVMSPEAIRRIEIESPGYAGYHPAMGAGKAFLPDQETEIQLGEDEYLALGDNTRNSLDGRYWGPVPEPNLVGPAMIVYWPLSRRWGFIE